MSDLIALDIAILPPPATAARAIALSTALPADDFQGLRLDDEHLPHITLTQLFVRVNELEDVFARVDDVVRSHTTLTLRATGGGQGTNSLSMAIERTPELVELHEQLMESLRGLERTEGGTAAFADHDARVRDVLWVAGYRLKSSFGHYTPHITLGHGSQPPTFEPFSFEATTVAACHLGRFCTCRSVLRSWELGPRQ